MNRMVRVTLLLLAVTAAGVAYWLLAGRRQLPESVAVQRGNIEVTLEVRGRLALERTYVVACAVAGLFEPAPLREGQEVSEGEILGRVDPARYEAAVRIAEARLREIEQAVVENEYAGIEETLQAQIREILASLDHTIAASEARTESARSRFEYQREYLTRVQRLFERQAISEDELHRAQVAATDAQVELRQAEIVERALRSLRQAVAVLPTTIDRWLERRRLHTVVIEQQRVAARHRLELARLDFERSTVSAPVPGVLLAFPVRNPRPVPVGETVAEIGRWEDLEVRADVLTSDAVQLRPGVKARLMWSPGDAPFGTATLDRIEPRGFTKISSLGVEEQRVWVHLRPDTDTLQHLRQRAIMPADFGVRVQFLLARKTDALIVPRTALYQDESGRWWIDVLEQGTPVPRQVEIGLKGELNVEVIRGLREGEEVVLVPEH